MFVTETWASEGVNVDRLQDFEVGEYDLFLHCKKTWKGGGVFVYVFSLLCTTEVADSMEVNTVEYVLLDMKTGSGKRHRLKEGVFFFTGQEL